MVLELRSAQLSSLSAVLALSALIACTDDAAPNASGAAGSANAAGQSTGGSSAASAGASTTGGAGATSGGTGNAGASAGGGTGGVSPNAGSSGSATAGSAGAGAATPSAGCAMPAGQELDSWVEQPMLDVAGTQRQWWLWLPENYDPMRAYPLVFNFHGCSNSNNIVPMQNVTGSDAILVRGTGISDNVCWDAGAEGDDLPFFDQMLADVSAKRCVDTSRVFATGYSSGSWLANMLECERGDKLRAIGTVSGGTFGNKDACKGKFARIFIHDQDDMDNRLDQGNETERDRLLEQNNCTAGAPVAEEPAPCARYQGCGAGFPVIWCQTMGKMHDRQDSLAPGAFWKLFSSL